VVRVRVRVVRPKLMNEMFVYSRNLVRRPHSRTIDCDGKGVVAKSRTCIISRRQCSGEGVACGGGISGSAGRERERERERERKREREREEEHRTSTRAVAATAPAFLGFDCPLLSLTPLSESLRKMELCAH
jgi:hypothetical protein